MRNRKRRVAAKWIAALMLVLLLSVLGGPSTFTQEPGTRYALGDIPLDQETYRSHLKLQREYAAMALPAAYDARSEGIVTPAKDQGACGSCWAFASAGAMESHLLKAYGFGPTDLSEQQQVSCNLSMSGCCGGSSWSPRFWETIGPIYESCFGYGESGTSCPTQRTVACSGADGCEQLIPRVVDWHTVSASNFKISLYSDGPSYWRYDVYDDFFDYWDDADPGDVYVNGAGTNRVGGHAVLLIGWDDGKGAYLCKNSWGASGGPHGDGTFWIAYSGHHHNLGFGMSNFSLNSPPNADADGPYEANEGETFTLDGSGSSDPDNNIVQYEWDLDNDGQYDDATGVMPSVVFGDNGLFTVGLRVTDQYGESDTDTTTALVHNLPPSLTLDESTAVTFPGGTAFVGRKGVEQTHGASATDPGSDDLSFHWGFGATAIYYNDGVGPDPLPSPWGTFPFTAADSASVTFTAPGVDTIAVDVSDDDGGANSADLPKLVTDDYECARSQGFWQKQVSGKGRHHRDQPTMLAYLDVVNFASAVFSEEVPASNIVEAREVMRTSRPDLRDNAERQLLAAWLNFAQGAVGWDELIDTDDDGVGDTTFLQVMSDAEAILLDTDASRRQIRYAKDLGEAVNLSDQNNPACPGN